MANVNALLSERLKKSEKLSKMSAMAEKSASGNLTSFSGLFNLAELSEREKSLIKEILTHYASERHPIGEDLKKLLSITSEVKAITNQAALLHGERIKKAQQILKSYREGAFTAWMIATYGNRQTPYNLLQYYEFYESLPSQLKSKVDGMPRQAIYTLASREGELEAKKQFIENYKGQTKAELLNLIRELFPLNSADKRGSNPVEQAIATLAKLNVFFANKSKRISKGQKQTLLDLIDELRSTIEH